MTPLYQEEISHTTNMFNNSNISSIGSYQGGNIYGSNNKNKNSNQNQNSIASTPSMPNGNHTSDATPQQQQHQCFAKSTSRSALPNLRPITVAASPLAINSIYSSALQTTSPPRLCETTTTTTTNEHTADNQTTSSNSLPFSVISSTSSSSSSSTSSSAASEASSISTVSSASSGSSAINSSSALNSSRCLSSCADGLHPTSTASTRSMTSAFEQQQRYLFNLHHHRNSSAKTPALLDSQKKEELCNNANSHLQHQSANRFGTVDSQNMPAPHSSQQQQSLFSKHTMSPSSILTTNISRHQEHETNLKLVPSIPIINQRPLFQPTANESLLDIEPFDIADSGHLATDQITDNLNRIPIREDLDELASIQAASDSAKHRLIDKTVTNNIQQQTTDNASALAIVNNGNQLIGYYFGNIARETAEWILKSRGCLDGSYLLRSSGLNDDFVLSLCHQQTVLHYKIVKTTDGFVTLHGLHTQLSDEKYLTIDELIDRAEGLATKPNYAINRHNLDSLILPPTFWGLSVDQIRLAIIIKAKQWGFANQLNCVQQQTSANATDKQVSSSSCPGAALVAGQAPLAMSGVAVSNNGSCNNNTCSELARCNSNQNNASSYATSDGFGTNTTTNNETIRTLIYKSLHEFQPWFHGKISRNEAEFRIEEGGLKDGRFLVRERDNCSYAMCISYKKAVKHYRIDVLPTGELAIQDGRRFTSLMALVSHYTLMSDGLWCALTEACQRPLQLQTSLQASQQQQQQHRQQPIKYQHNNAMSYPSGASILTRPAANIYSTGGNLNLNNGCDSRQQQLTSCFTMQQSPHLNEALGPQPTICQHSDLTAIKPFINGAPLSPSNSHQQSQSMLEAYLQSQHNNGYGGAFNPQNTTTTTKNHNNNSSQLVGNSFKVPIKEWLHSINHKWTRIMATRNQTLNNFIFKHQQHNINTNSNHQNYNDLQPLHFDPTQTVDATSRFSGQKQFNNQVSTALFCPCYSCRKQQLVHSNNNNALSSFTSNRGAAAVAAISGDLTSQIQQRQLTTDSRDATGSVMGLAAPTGPFHHPNIIGSPLFAPKSSLPPVSLQLNKINHNNKKLSSCQQHDSIHHHSGNSFNPYNLNYDLYDNSQPTTIAKTTSEPHQSIQQQQQMETTRSRFPFETPFPLSCRGFDGPSSNEQQPATPDNCQLVNCHKQQQQQHDNRLLLRHNNHNNRASLITTCKGGSGYKSSLDDSNLVSMSTRLMAPAAMAKFVQFQNGQCLGTYRDLHSIQRAATAAAMSGQQQQYNEMSSAIKLAQNRTNKQQHTQQVANGSNQLVIATTTTTATNNNNNITQQQQTIYPRISALMHQRSQHDQFTQYNEHDDLMDCNSQRDDEDLWHVNFKYDPKLIKSSSIETLYELNTDRWLSSDNSNGVNKLQLMNCSNNNETMLLSQEQQHRLMMNSNILKASQAIACPLVDGQTIGGPQSDTNNNCRLISSNQQQQQQQQVFNMMTMSVNNKSKMHDLDELTTSLLAELTQSLRDQVEMKNKKSGLTSSTTASHTITSQQQQQQQQVTEYGQAAMMTSAVKDKQDSSINEIVSGLQQTNYPHQQQQQLNCNPIELLKEFDSIYAQSQSNHLTDMRQNTVNTVTIDDNNNLSSLDMTLVNGMAANKALCIDGNTKQQQQDHTLAQIQLIEHNKSEQKSEDCSGDKILLTGTFRQNLAANSNRDDVSCSSIDKHQQLSDGHLSQQDSDLVTSELENCTSELSCRVMTTTTPSNKNGVGGPLLLDRDLFTLEQKIGSGFFGNCYLASIWPTSHTKVQVAVKMLKEDAVTLTKSEIMKEASTMTLLDHKHIIKLIGVCEGDPFMLVMELAPLGPLTRYLAQLKERNLQQKKLQRSILSSSGYNSCSTLIKPVDDDNNNNNNNSKQFEIVLHLMLQVTEAMEYLEQKHYVHRDLAARNVLLVNERFAKVSDFGMSIALDSGQQYYKAQKATKWPLKWYAPECIYYLKFSTKSDVWSFGVALWEAMAYGKKPYEGMDGKAILQMFQDNKRLPKPDDCPTSIYNLMWSCWSLKPEDRPDFAQIYRQLKVFYKDNFE